MNATESHGPGSPDSEFGLLFEQSLVERGKFKEGDIVSGTVIAVTKDTVLIDIGYKSEGTIALSEFIDGSGETKIGVGNKVDVLLEHSENEDGLVSLSKEKADRLRVWDEISAACERDEIIEGVISARVKGGLSVSIRGGVKAFLPGSQVDLRPIRNLDKLIGQSFQFKVIKFNKKRGNIVLSRRVLLEKARDELKQKTLETLQEGMVVEGIVKNITEYGAFVDLGGIDGLLHITDMSWGRVNHPSEMFQVGDTVQVMVLKYNSETERVSLGLKQTQDDPWNHAEEAYPQGKKVKGKVVSITDYGAFVELEQGIEGLIHVSEMSWTKKVKHPSKLLNIGDEIECAVLDVDARSKRISLGLKQLEPDPWTVFVEKYRPGDRIGGQVRSLTDYGVFVGIEEGVDGMVHKSDISWTQRVNHPSEVYQKGDAVEAVILNIDHEAKKVSLGIKQLFDDPWDKIPKSYGVGKVLEVVVKKVTDFGAFVELEKGIEGLVHVSEMAEERVDDPHKVVKEGDTVRAVVIHLDASERRIGLSMKAAAGTVEASEAIAFMQAQDKAKRGATLGDLIKEKLGDQVADLPSRPEKPGE